MREQARRISATRGRSPSAGSDFRMSRPNEMLRRTDRFGNIAVSWNTKARLRSLGATRVRLRPLTQIASALSGRSRPAMQRSVVVLPQPDGPSRTRSSPDSISQIDVVAGDHRAAAEGLPQVIDSQAVGAGAA